MNRFLLASALVLGVSGAAMAQQAPVNIGDYSAPVQSQLDLDAHRVNAVAHERTHGGAAGVDRTTTASTNQTATPSTPQIDGRWDDAYNR